jgi:flagellar hook-basal body complex protein FliE
MANIDPSMNIGPIQPIKPVPGQGGAAGASGVDFKDVLSRSIKQLSEVNQNADQAIEQMATGELQDVHQVMIALEKASLTFKTMMQIRTKLLDAYQEVMRMRF